MEEVSRGERVVAVAVVAVLLGVVTLAAAIAIVGAFDLDPDVVDNWLHTFAVTLVNGGVLGPAPPNYAMVETVQRAGFAIDHSR